MAKRAMSTHTFISRLAAAIAEKEDSETSRMIERFTESPAARSERMQRKFVDELTTRTMRKALGIEG